MFSYRYPTAWFFHRSTIHTEWEIETPADKSVFVKPDCGYTEPGAMKSYSAATQVHLPDPEVLTMPIGVALAERASCRQFGSQPLTAKQLSPLLKAAYGVYGEASAGNTHQRERPVPSAGGRYPLEIYLLLWNVEGIRSGTYHYEPLQHTLEYLHTDPPRARIPLLFLNQPYLGDAAALVVLTGIVDRQLDRYRDRGYRYLLIEAGHVAQNFGLVAAAIGVGSLSLGGFMDDSVAALLDLQQDCEVALYGVALGARATPDRLEGRGLGTIANHSQEP
jgi:SagB-type dehydrogenase family enzyme